MEQFKRIWGTMSASQRISIGLATVGFIGALMWLSSWRHEANFKPLFRGLDSGEAADAVQKLRESGVEFRLADNGGTILVSEQQLAETRLSLAREGLPKTGRMGFELFDSQNFGTTDFAEQVNYRRALEGELERTIATINEVEKSRVHLTFAKESVFTENRQPSKAAVLLNLRRSTTLSAENVAAIANLVASAVEGLSPKQITILDSNGQLLNRPRSETETASAPEGQMEYRVALERDMQNKLTQTLDPVLGFDKYRAGVSIDVDFSNVQESEEKWDPNNSVMASSQRTEESNNSQSAGGGVPGTQANLPDEPARVAATSGVTRKTESTTFQTSRTVRHVDKERGTVKRVTVAVLLDQDGKWQGNGSEASLVFTPPPPEKIEVIKNLVTNVAGLSMERGDQITVETLPFTNSLHQDPPSAPAGQTPGPTAPVSVVERFKDPKILGAFVAVFVILLGTAFWMFKRRGKKPAVALVAAGETGQPGQLSAASGVIENLSTGDLARLEQSLLESLRVPAKTISKSDTLAKYLRQEVKQNPHLAAQTLRTWLLEEGKAS
ncbi:MAG: flagellar basal-body MS-ring/collar protein FliF [Acidobacteriota bacterium]